MDGRHTFHFNISNRCWEHEALSHLCRQCPKPSFVWRFWIEQELQGSIFWLSIIDRLLTSLSPHVSTFQYVSLISAATFKSWKSSRYMFLWPTCPCVTLEFQATVCFPVFTLLSALKPQWTDGWIKTWVTFKRNHLQNWNIVFSNIAEEICGAITKSEAFFWMFLSSRF